MVGRKIEQASHSDLPNVLLINDVEFHKTCLWSFILG